VKVLVKNDCVLQSDEKMHLPGAILDVPSVSDADSLLITDFALKRGMDIVTASFARKAEDVEEVRRIMDDKGKGVQVWAKIQSMEGIRAFDEILAAADGVMIDRQSLSMEMFPDKALIAQKWMVMKANVACKPVVTYMQEFDSMIIIPDPNVIEGEPLREDELQPTRGEANDILV
jgi:pyruvate kinase